MKLLFIPAMAIVIGLSWAALYTTTTNARETRLQDTSHIQYAKNWNNDHGNRLFRVSPGHTVKSKVPHGKHNAKFDHNYAKNKKYDEHTWYNGNYEHRNADYRRHDYSDHYGHYRNRDDGIDFLSLNVILPGMNLLFGSVR